MILEIIVSDIKRIIRKCFVSRIQAICIIGNEILEDGLIIGLSFYSQSGIYAFPVIITAPSDIEPDVDPKEELARTEQGRPEAKMSQDAIQNNADQADDSPDNNNLFK